MNEKEGKKLNESIKSWRKANVTNGLALKEAEKFEIENKRELNPYGPSNTPYNRFILIVAGEKWAVAGELKKAEEYFIKAGDYGYPHAAILFDKLKDQARAVKFWTLAAQHPLGYFSEQDEYSGRCWERAGNLPLAIQSYKEGIDFLYSQDGGVDMHGDIKCYKGVAKGLEERVNVLERLISEGKGFTRIFEHDAMKQPQSEDTREEENEDYYKR